MLSKVVAAHSTESVVIVADVHRLIDELLDESSKRRGISFSTRTYADQPILQTGRELQERQEQQYADRQEERRQARSAARGSKRKRRRRRRQRRETPVAGTVNDAPRWFDAPKLVDATDDDVRGIETISLQELFASVAEQETEPLPTRYRKVRRLERSDGGRVGYGGYASGQLFYEQARLMEHFEDDHPFTGYFVQYYPTFAGMSDAQLRGYITWRTRVRHGEVREAPLSYAFVYAYELLCGVGTTPGEQGYRDLVDFWHAFGTTNTAQGSAFDSYLRTWTHDYAVYHGIVEVLGTDDGAGGGLLSEGNAVAMLLDAEEAVLARGERTRKLVGGTPVSPDATLPGGQTPSQPPTEAELFDALATVSRYRIGGSRLYKERPDEVRTVVAAVFAALVEHCSRRRKTDFVEGLFGLPKSEPYAMFVSAVFYDPEPHADAEVRVSRAESYSCEHGRWRRTMAYRREGRNRELGTVLHEVDRRMRERLGFASQLKARGAVPKYLGRIVDEAIDGLLERQRQEEARRIDIDLSKLAGIRAAAATTREALLVDEERAEQDVAAGAELGAAGPGAGAELGAGTEPKLQAAGAGPAAEAEPKLQATEAGPALLSPTEQALVSALLNGDSAAAEQHAAASGQLLSVLVDSINEKLFDQIGDAAIEYVDDVPIIVPDYEQDLREWQ